MYLKCNINILRMYWFFLLTDSFWFFYIKMIKEITGDFVKVPTNIKSF